MKITADTMDKLANIVDKLVYYIKILYKLVFALSILVEIMLYKIFFKNISDSISIFIKGWKSMPEAYQLYILGIPTVIITGVITYFLIKSIEKIKK